jgi:hypothetical protein
MILLCGNEDPDPRRLPETQTSDEVVARVLVLDHLAIFIMRAIDRDMFTRESSGAELIEVVGHQPTLSLTVFWMASIRSPHQRS